MHKGFFVFWVFFFILVLSATEGYSYTITAGAGAGGTISPSGAVPVATGANQTFSITPDLGYEVVDVVVDSVSVGIVPSYAFSNIAADHAITASFASCGANLPVMLEYDGSPFTTIQEAYDYASITLVLPDFTLLLMGGNSPEDLFLDQDVSVFLDGGYDCSFLSNTMRTSITGSLIISAGTVTLSNMGATSPSSCAFDLDRDGHYTPGSCFTPNDDCDDNDPNNFPGNPEICDSQDNNCNGQVDEGLSSADADGDSYSAIGECGGSADDCNDNNSNINPGAMEIPGDGIDQDCNGQDLVFPEIAECSDCHGSVSAINSIHANFPTPNNTCADCHAVPVSNILPGHYGKTVRTTGNNMTAGSVINCFSCHDADSNNHSGGVALGNGSNFVTNKIVAAYPNITCDTCHENRAAVHATYTAHNNRIIDSACGQCHTLNSQADVDTLHPPDCSLCHNYTGIKLDVGTVRQAIQLGLNGIQITCTTCHTGKTPDDGHGVPGSGKHTAHLALPGASCTTCHESGNIPYFKSGSDSPPFDGLYDLSETDVCDACHQDAAGNPTTGVKAGWIVPYFEVDCGSCHGLFPHTGGHDAHENLHNMCSNCHDGTSEASTAPEQHLDGNIDVYDTVPGDLNYPVDKAIATPYATCTDIYCHSPGTTNSSPYSAKIVTWGGSAPPAESGICAYCHNTGDTDDYLVTGSHYRHVNYERFPDPNKEQFDCSKCHAATSSDNLTITDYNKHVNREVDVAFDPSSVLPNGGVATYTGVSAPVSKTPGSAYGDCSNTYCHSQGSSVTPPYPAPNYPSLTWGMDATNFGHPDNPTERCSACHGAYDDVSYGGINTNAHQAHVGDAALDKIGDTIGCSNCHRAITGGGMRLDTLENHIDGFVEIKFEKDLTDYRGINFDTDGPSGTGPAYAGQNTAGDNLLTDFAQVVPDTATKYSCTNLYCHSNGNLAANVNDVDPASNWGEGALADPETAFKSIEWNGTTHISCDGCHGDASGNAHPTYANGGAGTITANSHAKHVVNSQQNCTYCHVETLSDTSIPPTGGVISEDHVNRLEDVSLKDINGQTGTYDNAVGSKTCSSTYCHGVGTPQWGGTVACGDCHAVNGTLAGMHASHYDSPNNASSLLASNKSTADAYIFSCGVCHDTNHPDYMGHATGPVNPDPAHNQTAEVYFDTMVAGGPVGGIGWITGATAGIDPVGFPWTDQECGNMYCHSPGNKNAAPYDGAPATPNWVSGFSGECWECHAGDAQAQSTMASGSHSKHVLFDMYYPMFDCVSCHDATVSDSRTIADKSKHVNRDLNISFDSASVLPNGATATYDGENAPMTKAPGTAYGDCSNTYCHSQGTSITPPYPAPNKIPTWGTPFVDHNGNNTSCGMCHGSIYEYAESGDGDRISTNAHRQHAWNWDINNNQDFWGWGCSDCHYATGFGDNLIAPSGIPNHINQKVNVKFRGEIVYDSDAPTFNGLSTTTVNGAEVEPGTVGAQCNNVYCHSIGNLDQNIENNYGYGEGTIAPADTDGDGSPDAFWQIPWNTAWNVTPDIQCDGCHGDQAGRAHPTYPNGGAGTLTANSHVQHVEDANLDCTYCHEDTEDTNIPPTYLWPSTGHLNRLEDVKIKPLADTIPDVYEAEGFKTCTATYCHSNGTEVATGTINKFPLLVWGGASMTCDSCHNTTVATNNLGPDYPNGSPKANSHAVHQGFGCETCHYSTTSDGITITNIATHVNQVYDIEASSGIAFNYFFASNGSTCTNISCHGSGDAVWGAPPAHTTVAVGPNDLSNGTSCSTCHVVADWTEIEGTEHNVATNGAGSCATCHNSPRQDVIDVITAGTDPANCLDCHADKTAAHGSIDHVAQTYVTVGGTQDYYGTTCSSCHDPGGAANATVAVTHNGDCSLCHTTIPNLQPGVPAGGGDCVTCHTTYEHTLWGRYMDTCSSSGCHTGFEGGPGNNLHDAHNPTGGWTDRNSATSGLNYPYATDPNMWITNWPLNPDCATCHKAVDDNTKDQGCGYCHAFPGKGDMHLRHSDRTSKGGMEIDCQVCHGNS